MSTPFALPAQAVFVSVQQHPHTGEDVEVWHIREANGFEWLSPFTRERAEWLVKAMGYAVEREARQELLKRANYATDLALEIAIEEAEEWHPEPQDKP